MEKLSIYISTFDGYSDLWDSFFQVFEKYYSHCSFNLYMSTNFKDYSFKNLEVIKTGEETTWINRNIKALEKIDSEYVLFMLEDYLIGNYVNETQINEILEYIDVNNIDYYRLQNIPKCDIENNKEYIGKIQSKQKYGINTIGSIWKKSFLLGLLIEAQNMGVYSAWDYEVFLCNKFNKLNEKYIPNCVVDTRDILAMKNGVYRGKWFRSTLKYFKKDNLELDTKSRSIMSIKSTIYYDLKIIMNNCLSVKSKENIKDLLRLIGFKFLSDKKYKE